MKLLKGRGKQGVGGVGLTINRAGSYRGNMPGTRVEKKDGIAVAGVGRVGIGKNVEMEGNWH